MILTALLDDRPCMYKDVPATAPYLKECVKPFEALNLKQDTTQIGQEIEGEPIFYGHRYEITHCPIGMVFYTSGVVAYGAHLGRF